MITEMPDWRWWVTSKPLRDKPIHRWYIFPHSFTSELVDALIQEWNLSRNDIIIDPFVGAGTTLLAARSARIPAIGYDLSPLAVFVTKAKVSDYDALSLHKTWKSLESSLATKLWDTPTKSYPRLVEKALAPVVLGAFENIMRKISELSCTSTEKHFFLLAVLGILPQYSRAVAAGGWLKWVDKTAEVDTLKTSLGARVGMMLEDLAGRRAPTAGNWGVEQADARQLPSPDSTYSAVITSPPYPNRHDYTRVFGVELMLAFLSWQETKELRYQTLHSHPEARPRRPSSENYVSPAALSAIVARLSELKVESRITDMIEGYFLDIYLCLIELKRVCRHDAPMALVVGNAQYNGEPIFVDELIAELAGQAGLQCQSIRAARYRGNSAQQMGVYGRRPSRESVVILRNSLATSGTCDQRRTETPVDRASAHSCDQRWPDHAVDL